MKVWGCMGWNGVAIPADVEGRMGGDQCVSILKDCLLPSMEYSGLPPKDIIFCKQITPSTHPNWPQNGLKTMILRYYHCQQSPDLNTIQNLRELLKRLLTAYQHPPEEQFQLWERVAVEWKKIAMKGCQKLIESMSRRVVAVIKTKGGHTKYQNYRDCLGQPPTQKSVSMFVCFSVYA